MKHSGHQRKGTGVDREKSYTDMTLLDEIIAFKKTEVRNQKLKVPFKKLEQSPYFERTVCSLIHSLTAPDKNSIITEFKRRSPSKGIINDLADVKTITKGYADGGASGLSVLTDNKFFGGSEDDLMAAREVNTIPILRKDFTIDEYQVIESKALGADSILLIAACLSTRVAKSLARLAKSVNLQVIMEIHQIADLEKANEYVDIIGVNNRDLKTFEVDVETSIKLEKEIPADFPKISESGINDVNVIKRLKEYGYNGFLIGEHFMKEKNPVKAFLEFAGKIPVGFREG